jgi:hypothetical protein
MFPQAQSRRELRHQARIVLKQMGWDPTPLTLKERLMIRESNADNRRRQAAEASWPPESDETNQDRVTREWWRSAAEDRARVSTSIMESLWDRVHAADAGRPYTAEQITAWAAGPRYEDYANRLLGPNPESVWNVWNDAIRDMERDI